jgi:putative membrane protein
MSSRWIPGHDATPRNQVVLNWPRINQLLLELGLTATIGWLAIETYLGVVHHLMGIHAAWWLFWLVAAGTVWFSLRGRQKKPGNCESPRELLARRLASGEIQPDEYQERIALLNRDS